MALDAPRTRSYKEIWCRRIVVDSYFTMFQEDEVDIMERQAFSIFAILFLVSFPIVADQPEQSQHDNIRVRTEYKHSMDTPNHLVFWSVLRSVQSRDAQDHDVTVQIILARFDLVSAEDAEMVLANMLVTANAIKNEHLEIRNTILCKGDRAQEKVEIFRRMDAVDDARDAATRHHYLSYMSSLDASEEVNFLRWLDERKKTYSYRTAEHESLYEGSGIDVIAFIDQACAKWGLTK